MLLGDRTKKKKKRDARTRQAGRNGLGEEKRQTILHSLNTREERVAIWSTNYLSD